MTRDLEVTLRKSLDEVDRGVRFFVATWVLMTMLVLSGLIWLGHLARTSDVKTMLIVAVITLLFAQSVSLLLSSALMASMTRKTLKALELLSKE